MIADPAAITIGNKIHETFVIGLNSHLYCKVHDVTGNATDDAGWYDLVCGAYAGMT